MIYLFGDCELDTERYTLHRDGQPVSLRPKAFQVLIYLIDQRDRVISKQEFADQAWPEQFISDATLNTTVGVVRRAIGDNSRPAQLIQTLHRQGYRFAAPVTIRPQAPAAEAVEPIAEQAQAETAEAPIVSPTISEAKQVTILCCGLDHTSPEPGQVGLEALYGHIQVVYERAHQVAERYDGTIQHIAGDYLMLVFGDPVAYEDHAQRAVRAALEFLDGLRVPDSRDGTAPVRIALHSGQVLVGGLGSAEEAALAVIGETVTEAMALHRQATPGIIVCSAATAHLVQESVRVEANPAAPSAAGTTYRVVGPLAHQPPTAPHEQPHLSQFVGREHELRSLHALLDKVEQGQGQVVGIVGEAGIGKTRLTYEFRRNLQQRERAYWTCHCPSYGQHTPYLPLLTLLRQLWDINTTDPPEATGGKVRQHLAAVELAPEDWTAYILWLLDIAGEVDLFATVSPPAIRMRAIEALVQFMLRSARQQPLVLEVENLHWLDPSTEDVLTALVERLAGTSILLLTTCRPGYRPPWSDKSYASQISLAGLSPAESRRIVEGIFGPHHVPEPVLRTVVGRAHGNPLFLEELASMVGDPVTDPHGQPVPETVQGVVSALLDRLPQEAKQLVQSAAVIGHEVPLALLRLVSEGSEAAIDEQLIYLQRAELLHDASLNTEQVYRFKHILIQEATYQSQLLNTRQQVHERIARVMVEQFPNTDPERLAYHYTEAGLTEPAINYWERAGQHALQRLAMTESIGHFRQGLTLLQTLPDSPERMQRELSVLMAMGPALMATRGYASPEMERAYSRAQSLCEALGELPQLFPVRFGLWVHRLVRGEYQTARILAEALLRLAEQPSDSERLLIAYHALGSTLAFTGDLSQARIYLERSIALYDTRYHHDYVRLCGLDMGVAPLAILPPVLWLQGYPEQARTRQHEALTLAKELGHPYSLCFAQESAMNLFMLYREVTAVQTYSESLHTLATEQGFHLSAVLANIGLGWGLSLQGHAQAGIIRLRDVIAVVQENGFQWHHVYLLALLGEMYGRAGQPEAGLLMLAEALELDGAMGGSWWAAELHRVQGELLLIAECGRSQSPCATAWAQRSFPPPTQSRRMRNAKLTPEDCFLKALAIAHRQQAKSWELRAAMSLARLWQGQGRHKAARELLAPVYNGFTEGLDTADLQEARALLETL